MAILFESDSCTIGATRNTRITRIEYAFFLNAKNIILGKKYELSLVFVGDKKMKDINTHYRGKNYVTDILSFDHTKTSGEIFINLNKTYQKSKHFDQTPGVYLKYLFIHGLLHLKGHTHEGAVDSKKMTSAERLYCKKLNIPEITA